MSGLLLYVILPRVPFGGDLGLPCPQIYKQPVLTFDRSIVADVNPSGGSSIINVAYNKDEPATYCCGTPISVDGSVVCPDDAESFEVASGSVIFDRAILFDSPSSAEEPANTATETAVPGNCGGAPCESCHETVVGAGVGVPLGVIALGSIIWALWERRRTKKQTHAPTQWAADPAKQPYTQNAPTPAVPAAPAELENSTPIHQLMDTERR